MGIQYKALVWSDFKKLWNESESIQDVVDKTEQSKSAASSLASRMRSRGWDMKYFNKPESNKRHDELNRDTSRKRDAEIA